MTDIDQEIEPPLHRQLSTVDAPMERKRVGDMVVDKFAGLTITEYREAIEFAKLMSQGRNSVPPYLKQNPGDCLAIVTQALRWRLEPFWVAQHSYVARAESLIAYDSAVHAAIVLSSGQIKTRPRYTYEGEGEDRTCTVSVMLRGEPEPFTYTSPPLSRCRPKRNEQGVTKGSPLWDKDPDQQLGYFSMRNWGRRHMPEILGGVYDPEEFEDTTQDDNPDELRIRGPVSPNLLSRLPGKIEGAGFAENVVDTGLAEKVEEIAEAAKTLKKQTRKVTQQADTAEPAGEAAAPAPSQEAPKPEQAPAPPPQPPQTAEEYMAYAAKWIESVSNPDDLEARWDGEVDLRQSLKVPLAVRKRLEGMLRERTAALRKGSPRRIADY